MLNPTFTHSFANQEALPPLELEREFNNFSQKSNSDSSLSLDNEEDSDSSELGADNKQHKGTENISSIETPDNIVEKEKTVQKEKVKEVTKKKKKKKRVEKTLVLEIILKSQRLRHQ
eukprot:scaffold64781_cov32-Attheya_sp.AAC.1